MTLRPRIARLLVFLLAATAFTFAQDDPVRIETELVQQRVFVLDKQGRPVKGLKKEDFNIRHGGRQVPIAFFEAGSGQLARSTAGTDVQNAVRPTSPGSQPVAASYLRAVVFFLDDLHLSPTSIDLSRQLLSQFIEKQMGDGDQVAVASSSGRIGFLQQFTDNKDVLRAAVARIGHVPYTVTDLAGNPRTPMTEYMALAIEKREAGVLEFYTQDCLLWMPRGASPQEREGNRRHCELNVQNRARQVLLQAGEVVRGTYLSLESLVKEIQNMPGSKVAYFLSDGFLIDTGPRSPAAPDGISRLAEAAQRSGVIINSIDVRGLVSGSLDATGSVPFDMGGRLESANLRAIAASQDGMNALAVDTGGRALRNQNSFDSFVVSTLDEASHYYLIAWEPDSAANDKARAKRAEITLPGRPELTVRASLAYATGAFGRREGGDRPAEAAPRPEKAIRDALTDPYPAGGLPIDVSLLYLDTPASGPVITCSIQVPTDALTFDQNAKEPAKLTIAGVILDDKGKAVANFGTDLSVGPSGANTTNSSVIYNHRSPVKPGVYQARVAVRDKRSGSLGGARQWIVVPDLAEKRLTVSSLVIDPETVRSNAAGASETQWSITKRFNRGAELKVMAFAYNATRAGREPALNVKLELLRNGQSVATARGGHPKPTDQTDSLRIPVAAAIKLPATPGRYTLKLTIEDLATNTTATQETAIHIN